MVAHFEMIFIRRNFANYGRRFFGNISRLLRIRQLQIGEHTPRFSCVHGELREGHRAFVLKLAAEPSERCNAFDAGNFFNDGALSRG